MNERVSPSRKNWIINRTCLNKKSYSKKVADVIIDSYAKENILMYYYKCDFCNSHHLTKNEPNKKQKLEIK